jgi:hypothetical protein
MNEVRGQVNVHQAGDEQAQQQGRRQIEHDLPELVEKGLQDHRAVSAPGGGNRSPDLSEK